MDQRTDSGRPGWVLAAMLASGVSIGWLMGLSASPTAQTVIPALLAAVVAHVGGAGGLKAPEGTVRLAVGALIIT